MRLGEALARRSEVQARLSELRSRMAGIALVQKGDKPSEEPAQLLKELDELCGELERLVRTINATNSRATLEDGRTLTSALAERDALSAKFGALTGTLDAVRQNQARYSRSEIMMVRPFDMVALREQRDAVAQKRRELDTAIQAANWSTELEES